MNFPIKKFFTYSRKTIALYWYRTEVSLAAFLSLLAVQVLHDLSHGAGYLALVVSLAIMVLASSAAGILWYVLVPAKFVAKNRFVTFSFLIMFSRFLAPSIYTAVDEVVPYRKAIMQSQIEHFCFYDYEWGGCVSAMRACPSCIKSVNQGRRDIIFANLSEHLRIIPAEPGSVAVRTPASTP